MGTLSLYSMANWLSMAFWPRREATIALRSVLGHVPKMASHEAALSVRAIHKFNASFSLQDAPCFSDIKVLKYIVNNSIQDLYL